MRETHASIPKQTQDNSNQVFFPSRYTFLIVHETIVRPSKMTVKNENPHLTSRRLFEFKFWHKTIYLFGFRFGCAQQVTESVA